MTEAHPAEVLEVRRLSPSLVRVELGGLTGLISLGVPDEACVVEFPVAGQLVEGLGRWYTARRFDERAGRLTLDCDRRLKESGVDLPAMYREAEQANADSEDALDAYEATLDRIGLL